MKNFLFLCLFLIGCSNPYLIKYDTYLENSKPLRSLQYSDNKFAFNFSPEEHGVYFIIKNLTNKPAFLEWDRCYFIEPNGNSSKALNTDLLDQNKETSTKSTYESPIPSNGDFFRYTTSSMNLSRFIHTNVVQFYSTIFHNSYINTSITQNVFYSYAPYWRGFNPAQGTTEKEEFGKIKDYVINYNNMGLGLGIKLNDSTFDYKFDFKFKTVTIYKIGLIDTSICIIASESDNWKYTIPPPQCLSITSGYDWTGLLTPDHLQVKFSWSKISDAQTYHIQISTDSTFSSIVSNGQQEINDTVSLNNDNLWIGKFKSIAYYWRVMVKRKDGISPWSEIHSFSSADIKK